MDQTLPIGRLIFTDENIQIRKGVNPETGDLIQIRHFSNNLSPFLSALNNNSDFFILQSVGGLVRFYFDDAEVNENDWQSFIPFAEEAFYTFQQQQREAFEDVENKCRYFTVGVDGFSNNSAMHIELVAVYDTSAKEIIHWTGKSYPTESQKNSLVTVNDIQSHFIELDDHKVAILGCHDLNAYSPRGNANLSETSEKYSITQEFQQEFEDFQPAIVLQHPHTTDTPNIWLHAWNKLDKSIDSVQHYSSGILYFEPVSNVHRADLEDVLEKTKKGNIIDLMAN